MNIANFQEHIFHSTSLLAAMNRWVFYMYVYFIYLKSDSHLLKKFCVIRFIANPLKIMKNAFYFILKAIFVFKISKILSWKIRLTSEFMMSRPDLQTIATDILLNISRSKGNQTMKLGQLIEYNERNNFLQKLCEKWGSESSSRPLFIF